MKTFSLQGSLGPSFFCRYYFENKVTVTTMAQYLGTMRRDALDVSNNVFPLFHLKLSFSKRKHSLLRLTGFQIFLLCTLAEILQYLV
jgi:hypothetical protein